MLRAARTLAVRSRAVALWARPASWQSLSASSSAAPALPVSMAGAAPSWLQGAAPSFAASPSVAPVPAFDLGLPLDLPLVGDFPAGPPSEEPLGEAAPAMECLKRTFQPSLIIRKRRHGFLSRLATKNGRRVITRRKTKGRWQLTP